MNPFVMESPKWLLANGHFKQAQDTLMKMARMNGKKIPQDMLDSIVPQGVIQANLKHIE